MCVYVSPLSKEEIFLLCAKVVSNKDFRRTAVDDLGRPEEKQKLVSISSQLLGGISKIGNL